MTANQIPVGQFFVGHVDRDDWFHEDKRFFDGEKINVVLTLPKTDSKDEATLLMCLYAGLRSDHPLQLTDKWSMWVCGLRAKRSKFVRVVNWNLPDCIAASEKVCVELTSKLGNPKK